MRENEIKNEVNDKIKNGVKKIKKIKKVNDYFEYIRV